MAWDLDALLIQSRIYALVNQQALVYDQGMTRFVIRVEPNPHFGY